MKRVAALSPSRLVPRQPDSDAPTVLLAGLIVSLAAATALADHRLQRPALMAAAATAVGATLLLAPLFPLFLGLIATLPLADWKPPGSPLSISVVLAMVLALRVLVELPTLRPLQSTLVVRWTGLPLLLIPSAFLGAASIGARGQLFLSMASWFAIALLIAHFVDERRWRTVRRLLLAELVVALVVGGCEILAQRWLLPFPDPPQVHAEYFFGYFRPRSISLSPYALGEFLAFTAPLVWYELGLSLRRDRLGRLAWWTFIAAAQLALLVATLSRKSLWQALVALIVFLLVSLGDPRMRRRVVLVAAGIGAIAVVAINLNGPAFSERLTSSTSAEGVSLRVNTYDDAVTIGTEHMPLGAGLGNFVATSTGRYGEQFSAYNSFAEAFSDSGLLGLLAVVALVAIPIGAAARTGAKVIPPRAVVLGVLGGLIGLAVVESSIWRKSLAFGVGLCLALYLNGREQSGLPASRASAS